MQPIVTSRTSVLPAPNAEMPKVHVTGVALANIKWDNLPEKAAPPFPGKISLIHETKWIAYGPEEGSATEWTQFRKPLVLKAPRAGYGDAEVGNMIRAKEHHVPAELRARALEAEVKSPEFWSDKVSDTRSFLEDAGPNFGPFHDSLVGTTHRTVDNWYQI
ncbi:hypothetical protein FHS85_003453 [Rhodoligotrophos appendicifer]|uniref:hypothetical protein n=1 Tax=Rhodoligotrophos appendicifer TaxID=987056 RepID=UPI001185421B|nr:hypothetical protein [Rhodoligotrophos appendicifer]